MAAGDVSINEAKAPFVQFEKRPVEDRAASIEQGHYVAKDVDYALITPAGSKDRIEREVAEWFVTLREAVEAKRFPAEWLRSYQSMYKEWQAGNELPLNGTPIKTWSVCSPAQRENLISWKVMTVEALAEANEEVLRRLGMGGRELKNQAVDWLKSSNGQGKVTMELSQMRLQLEQLLEQNTQLAEQNKLLRMQMQAPAGAPTPPESPEESEGSSGLVETRTVTRKL